MIMCPKSIILPSRSVTALMKFGFTQVRIPIRFNRKGMVARSGYGAFVRDGVGMVWRPVGGCPEEPMPPSEVEKFCPHGKVNDTRWIKERFGPCRQSGATCEILEASYVCFPDGSRKFRTGDYYQQSETIGRPTEGTWPDGWRWKSSTHMPRWASRVNAGIEGVSVERLQDITETDAVSEGFVSTARLTPEKDEYDGLYAFDQFAFSWDETHQKSHSWAANPWVWRLELKKIENVTKWLMERE